ncbi:porin family protein [Phocaeicola sp. HCN-6420]|jgi:outer membrane protein W|uniref:porin family protein n=1 Tax=Phocaeicola sp. HCN-6420 TaxID=3134673 RepID=UPI0030BCC892
MKKLLLTVVLGLCTLAGFSQARFDVHAGMSMANITNSDADMKIGYSVGVGMDYAITDMWAFQTGLNFTSKGCKESEDGATAKFNPVYLDIPLLAAVKLPISEGNTFVINAGPYVGFGLGGKITVEQGGAEVGAKLFKKVDGADEAVMNRCAVGLQYGVGFELGYRYLLNLTGQYGFTNMIKESWAHESNKNLAFLITVGYRF